MFMGVEGKYVMRMARCTGLVTQQLLLALEPASLEFSLCAEDVQRERQRLDKPGTANWSERAMKLRAPSGITTTVEPENRLVARTLETAWEAKLREQQQLEEEYARFKSQQPVLPSEAQHAAIPETRLRDWIRRRWLHARKSGPTCIVWADGEEVDRLTKLSAFQQQHGRFQSYPGLVLGSFMAFLRDPPV